jgi:serum/glucocorticoid-regulated kinase 2
MEVLSKDFAETLRSEKDTAAYIGMIGLDPIPHNHGIRLTLNDRANTFAALISHRIRDIVIQPILVAAKPSYDKLRLSDFQLLQYLGSGGFSTVYLAKCEVDQRLCALKFIKKESITSAKKAKMLENEKEILFAIDSPDLVDLLYAFETPNYIVFGLEFCSNGNLYTFLHKHKRLSEADARIICHQILNGLEYLHDNSILFRDLKL